MRLMLRLLALLVVVPATYYFIFWVPFSLIPLGENVWIPVIVSSICALGAGGFVWKRLGSAPAGLASSALVGAAAVGGIGFCAGFFGPIIFTPDANQGPLLGIFITGPLGFLLGGVGGVAYWLASGRKSTTVRRA